MNENDVVVDDAKKKKSKLDIAMNRLSRMKAMEKRAEESAERERKAEEERKKRKAQKKEAEKALAQAKKELAAVRDYANVKREPSNIRKKYAVKGFFDLLDKCNKDGTRDFTDTYNFIGNTQWLQEVLMKNLVVNKNAGKLVIDIEGLRNDVFAKKKEIDEIIEKFNIILNDEWEERNENVTNNGSKTSNTDGGNSSGENDTNNGSDTSNTGGENSSEENGTNNGSDTSNTDSGNSSSLFN